jgi:hypothetical protein
MKSASNAPKNGSSSTCVQAAQGTGPLAQLACSRKRSTVARCAEAHGKPKDERIQIQRRIQASAGPVLAWDPVNARLWNDANVRAKTNIKICSCGRA